VQHVKKLLQITTVNMKIHGRRFP